MTRTLLLGLVALLAVLAWAPPALAVDPVSVSLHPSYSWLPLVAQETLYLPKGTADTSYVLVSKPYAGFWLFGVIDSFGATPTLLATVDWRARVTYPGTAARYWTPWTNLLTFTFLNDPDTLHWIPVWADDSLGWFDDLQFRVYDPIGMTDSAKLRLWVTKRYRR